MMNNDHKMIFIPILKYFPFCILGANECMKENGGCAHICVDTYDGYCCMCRTGYELVPVTTDCARK